MASNNYYTQEKDHLFSSILSELKALGVKVPKIKNIKSIIPKKEMALSEKGCRLFGVSLCEQGWTTEEQHPLPKFIVWATSYLQKFAQQEIGLFRKAGNIARQRNLRAKLERGESLKDADPNDVACLLKQWLRELPESLIPYYLQDLFIRCNNLDVEKNRVSACLFAILLLPPDHLHTLKHLLRFLSLISSHRDKNKMGVENLALIMAPNIFATDESAEKLNAFLNDHVAIIQLLIENSDKIGIAPPSIFQQTLLGSDLHASIDTLDSGRSKSKRKSGPVQDFLYGFKKLVGQNNSLARKNNNENNFLDTPKCPRQRLSLVNLDSPDFVTRKQKVETIKEEKKSVAHARRKSFGALLLRKKDRKRPENEIPIIVSEVHAKKLDSEDISSSENLKNLEAHSKRSCNFSNLKVNNAFNKTEKEYSYGLRNPKEARIRNLWDTSDDSVEKPVLNYSKSCKRHVENEPEVFKTPLPPKMRNSVSISKSKEKDKSCGKYGLSRQEAFIIKPIKQKAFSKIENKNLDKENNEMVYKESKKSLNFSCSNSSCNTKCDKNKSENCERISEKRTESKFCSRSLTQSQKNKTNSITPLPNSAIVSSRAASVTAISPSVSEPLDLMDVSENKGPQSLDLSLKLLLQNFCASPPNGSSEIKLSIDIGASNSNPELKLNISQKETSSDEPENISTSKIKPSSKNSATKTRKRLSSQSDSKITKFKKLNRSNRPSSFSGPVTESRLQTQHRNERSKTHSMKIQKIQIISDSAKEKPVELQRDSIFATPNSTTESWTEGPSKYWSPTSPSADVF